MVENESKKKISVTAYWGNDDAESTISLTPEQWLSIQNGGEHIEHSESWYEGESAEVTWSFANGLVTIAGEGGAQWLLDSPVSELRVES